MISTQRDFAFQGLLRSHCCILQLLQMVSVTPTIFTRKPVVRVTSSSAVYSPKALQASGEMSKDLSLSSAHTLLMEFFAMILSFSLRFLVRNCIWITLYLNTKNHFRQVFWFTLALYVILLSKSENKKQIKRISYVKGEIKN